VAKRNLIAPSFFRVRAHKDRIELSVLADRLP
jgi:hypothetical protein